MIKKKSCLRKKVMIQYQSGDKLYSCEKVTAKKLMEISKNYKGTWVLKDKSRLVGGWHRHHVLCMVTSFFYRGGKELSFQDENDRIITYEYNEGEPDDIIEEVMSNYIQDLTCQMHNSGFSNGIGTSASTTC